MASLVRGVARQEKPMSAASARARMGTDADDGCGGSDGSGASSVKGGPGCVRQGARGGCLVCLGSEPCAASARLDCAVKNIKEK